MPEDYELCPNCGSSNIQSLWAEYPIECFRCNECREEYQVNVDEDNVDEDFE